jgi:quercetin dioxygenase-like cupin family protein
VKVVAVGEIPKYVPDGHWGMEARKLAAGDPLEMTMCVMQPGGGAVAHQHDDRPQMLLVIDGRLTITAGEGTPIDVGAGQAAWFQPGEPHAVVNQQSTPARYFAISVIPG